MGKHIIIKKRLRFDNEELPPSQRRIDTGLSEQDLIKSLPKIYDGVIGICEEHPTCKGNYVELIYRYYRKFYPTKIRITFSQFKALMEVPSPESITRAFRKAVENGKIQPTEKMRLRREQREQAIRMNIHELGDDELKG